MLRYGEFITENNMIALILESKLVFSKSFLNIINQMSTNKVSDSLLKYYNNEVDNLTQNYIDITDDRDKVSFTPDRKVKEILKDKEELWVVTQSGRNLTHSNVNNTIFDALGYRKEDNEYWAPHSGILGTILAETKSTSGKTYALFKHQSSEKLSVINKEALNISEDSEYSKIWKTSRNPVNVGRLARAILRNLKIDFSDKDIETFVNNYKATYDLSKDKLKQFDIVSGDKIAYWYDYDNYTDGGGTLNNSCMRDVNSEYFDIYCENDNVRMVILYNDEGAITDGKYISSHIKGRAILWKCKIDGVDSTFMDRIYTTDDSDVMLFIEFAKTNNWWFKERQSMEPNEDISNGDTTKEAKIVAYLNETRFDYYPYMDTLCYISRDNDTASNMTDDNEDIACRSTDGEWEDVD
jgi:hypothetical protein